MALYRKYRPQSFDEVIDQNHIKITLQNQILTNRIGHAYLFAGPRAVGKTTLARVFAKSINCLKRSETSAESCGECENCQLITRGTSFDIFEIDAASHTGVENVRTNIIAAAQTPPSGLKYKVFIIDEAHMLSTPAFNALLKTMEEPPAYMVFILCTTETHKIPATIISRCQKFTFRKISFDAIVKKLEMIANEEKLEVEKEVFFAIARQSGGHMRDAESIFTQIIAVASGHKITKEDAELVIPRGEIAEVFNFLTALSKKDLSSALGIINSALENGVDLKIFANEAIELARKALISKISPALSAKTAVELGDNFEKELLKITAQTDYAYFIVIIENLEEATRKHSSYPLPQLSLEIASVKIVSFCHPVYSQFERSRIDLSRELREGEDLSSKKTIPALNCHPAPSPTYAPSIIAPANGESTQRVNNAISAFGGTPNSNFDITTVKTRWNEVVNMAQKISPSISFIARAAMPVNVEDGVLTLQFKYKIHFDQSLKPENRNALSGVLQSVFGVSPIVKPVLENAVAPQPAVNPPSAQPKQIDVTLQSNQNNNASDEVLNTVLQKFGGSVVG